MKRATTTEILPEYLIEKIISYLSFKEAAKMSILSKTWLQWWLTHPNIEFDIECFGENLEILDTIMKRYRDENTPIDRFGISLACFPHVSPPFDKWLDIAIQNGVKYMFYRMAHYPLPIFTILASKSLQELVVERCTLMPVSFSCGVTNCNSLRKLSLTRVKLDEKMLQTLFNCCPLIVSFIFEYCFGVEKIELLNLRMIKSVTIKTMQEPSLLVKIRAPTLEHLSYLGYSSKKSDIDECWNLKSLDISYMIMSDGFLQNLISRCQALKVLKIQYCWGRVEIDSSNLESFEYMGNKIPKLKIAGETRQLKHSKIVLQCSSNLNAAWFCELRKFLLNSISWPKVSLSFPGCNEINPKDLQLQHGVAAPKVDILNVNSNWTNGECPTFLDALLWSCHPTRLNVRSTSATFTCFINRLIYLKNLSHSPSRESEPWHSQLKEAQVYIFDDHESQSWRPVELKRGEPSTWTVSKEVEYFFLLDW